MAEVIVRQQAKIEASKALAELGVHRGEYFLVSAHRKENIDIERKFGELVSALNAIAEVYKKPIIFSTHPRTMKRIETKGVKFNLLIRNMKPFSFSDYCRLQLDSYCVLSDSGTLSEESSILHFPAVLLRNSTERPEVLDAGTIVIGGYRKETMLQSVALAVENFNPHVPIPKDYEDQNVSSKVVRIIQSYTRIIDTVIWDKS